jgi:hypothetical protein
LTVAQEIKDLQMGLQRHLNDVWILTSRLRTHLEKEADKLRASGTEASYLIPSTRKKGIALTRRESVDLTKLYEAQHKRGIFETNLISVVSRTEAFIQDCLAVMLVEYPAKMTLLSKDGIPLDLFLQTEDKSEVITRYVALKCEGLMYGKPKDYLNKFGECLDIDLAADHVNSFIEIKATRDIIIHNNGKINKSYVDKAGAKKRGKVGDMLPIDHDYFRSSIISLKAFSMDVRAKMDAKSK